MVLDYEGITVYYPSDMHADEAKEYVKEELRKKVKYPLIRVDINYHADGDLIIRPQYDTICRVRRITGYLSTLPKFNDAKKAEARGRVPHFSDMKDITKQET